MLSSAFPVILRENFIQLIQITKSPSAWLTVVVKPIIQILATNNFDLIINYHFMFKVVSVSRELNAEAESFSKTFE